MAYFVENLINELNNVDRNNLTEEQNLSFRRRIDSAMKSNTIKITSEQECELEEYLGELNSKSLVESLSYLDQFDE